MCLALAWNIILFIIRHHSFLLKLQFVSAIVSIVPFEKMIKNFLPSGERLRPLLCAFCFYLLFFNVTSIPKEMTPNTARTPKK